MVCKPDQTSVVCKMRTTFQSSQHKCVPNMGLLTARITPWNHVETQTPAQTSRQPGPRCTQTKPHPPQEPHRDSDLSAQAYTTNTTSHRPNYDRDTEKMFNYGAYLLIHVGAHQSTGAKKLCLSSLIFLIITRYIKAHTHPKTDFPVSSGLRTVKGLGSNPTLFGMNSLKQK